MDFIQRQIIENLWNICPHLITGMVKRSSHTSFVQKPSDLTEGARKAENRWPLYRILLYIYLAVAVFRFLFLAYVLRTGKLLEYQQYDVLMNIGMRLKILNFNSGIFISPLTIFIIHFDYTVYVKRFNNVPRLPYDIIVVNPTNFIKLNPSFRPSLSLREPIKMLQTNWQILYWFFHPPPGIRWSVRKLQYYPHISEKIRLRALLITWFFKLFIAIFLFCTALVILAGSIYYHWFFLVPNVDSVLKYLIGLIDLIIICIVAYHIIKLVLFLLQILLAVESIYHFYLLDLIAQFEQFCFEYRQKKISTTRMASQIAFTLAEANIGLHHGQSADIYLVSPLFFWGFLSNFSMNLYLITSLYFLKLSKADFIMIYCLLGLQIFFSLNALQPLIKLAGDVLRAGRMVNLAQILLGHGQYGRRFLGLKLKLLEFYEEIHREDRFSFTLGVLGRITNQSAFEFMFFYSGYLLFLFDFISEQSNPEERGGGRGNRGIDQMPSLALLADTAKSFFRRFGRN